MVILIKTVGIIGFLWEMEFFVHWHDFCSIISCSPEILQSYCETYYLSIKGGGILFSFKISYINA